MSKIQLLRTISKSVIITSLIAVPTSRAYASQDVQEENTQEPAAAPVPTIRTVSVAPSTAVDAVQEGEVDSVEIDQVLIDFENIIDDTDDKNEATSDEDIDAELQAELDRIEAAEKFTNPDELIKNFSLKKPLIELPTPDADRLMVANQIVSQLFPVGTSERSMRDNMDNLMLPMINRTLDLTMVEAIDLFGVPEEILGLDSDSEEAKELATKTLGDYLVEQEPKFREKMDVVFEAYAQITGLTSEPIEPFLAEAMARDYARKYDLAQLNDLKNFFGTPTGSIFARDFMLSTASIDMVQTALKEFPAIAANSDKIQEVSKRIEDAFKPTVNPEDAADENLDEQDCETCESDGTAALGAEDLGTEPWFEMDNWAEERRDNVNLLQDTYNELAELSEQAYSQYDEAFDAAVAESRAQYIADGWTPDQE